jgi:hypothetical protein
MSSRFTRNIHNIKNINEQDFNTNVQNDLLSDNNGEVFIRTKEKNNPQYYQLTNSVKSVNGVSTTDRQGAITIDVGVKTINNKKPDENGDINIQINNLLPFSIYESADNIIVKFKNDISTFICTMNPSKNEQTIINATGKYFTPTNTTEFLFKKKGLENTNYFIKLMNGDSLEWSTLYYNV